MQHSFTSVLTAICDFVIVACRCILLYITSVLPVFNTILEISPNNLGPWSLILVDQNALNLRRFTGNFGDVCCTEKNGWYIGTLSNYAAFNFNLSFHPKWQTILKSGGFLHYSNLGNANWWDRWGNSLLVVLYFCCLVTGFHRLFIGYLGSWITPPVPFSDTCQIWVGTRILRLVDSGGS